MKIGTSPLMLNQNCGQLMTKQQKKVQYWKT